MCDRKYNSFAYISFCCHSYTTNVISLIPLSSPVAINYVVQHVVSVVDELLVVIGKRKSHGENHKRLHAYLLSEFRVNYA